MGLVELYRISVCVVFFNVPSGHKNARLFTTVTTSSYQDQLNAGFSKVYEIFKVHGIESLKYIREFYTQCYSYSFIVVTFPRAET